MNNIRITQKNKQHSIISEDKFETIGAPSERGRSAKPPSQRQPTRKVDFADEPVQSGRKVSSKVTSQNSENKSHRKDFELISEAKVGSSRKNSVKGHPEVSSSELQVPSSKKSSVKFSHEAHEASNKAAGSRKNSVIVDHQADKVGDRTESFEEIEKEEEVVKEPSVVES